MLNPDCLLKNTTFLDNVKKYMKYAGAMMEESGKEPSFRKVYEHLREKGLEVDIESAGYAYQEAFGNESGYSTPEDIAHETGKEFEKTVWNKMVNEPAIENKENQIGELPPAKEIVKRLVNIFDWGKGEDKQTSSTLKTIQEAYHKVAKDVFKPEKEEGVPKTDNRAWDEVILDGLVRMESGHRDLETGLVHNLNTLHEAVNKELSSLTERLREKGEHVKADALEKAAKDLQSTEMAIALSGKEIKTITEGALKEGGYTRTTKSGETEVDWEKLSGEAHSAAQLREKVISAMKKKGLDDFTAEKVADLMQHELDEGVKTMTNIQLAKYEKDLQSNDKKTVKKDQSFDANAAIEESAKRWEHFVKYEGQGQKELILSAKTASESMKDILRSIGILKDIGGKEFLQSDELAKMVNDPSDIKSVISDYFSNQKDANGNTKYSPEMVTRLTNAMDMMAHETFDRLREHVEGKQAQVEKSWSPDTKPAKAEPTLSETIKQRFAEILKLSKISAKQGTLLTQAQAQNAIGDVLKNSIFGKEKADGSKVIDWKKLGSDNPTEADLRKLISNHLTTLQKDGITPEMADKVMESVDKLIPSLKADIEKHAQLLKDAETDKLRKSESDIDKTWQASTTTPHVQESIKDLINNRIKELASYVKATGDYARKLTFSRPDAKRIFSEAIKNSIFGKEKADGSKVIDWKKLGLNKPDEAALRKIINEQLLKEFPKDVADKVTEAIKDLFPEFTQDIADHAQSIIEAQEKAQNRESPERSSAIQRLSELHTLGAFSGAHEDLLKKVIGVSDITKADLQDIDAITKEYNEAMKGLTGNNLQNHANFFQAKVTAQINQIVARNINDRSSLLRRLNTVQDYFKLQNLMLISGTYNLFENFVSGQQGLIGANYEVYRKTGRMFSDRKLWWKTLIDEAMGATHGMTGEKFMGGTDVLNKYNSVNFRRNPVKATITAIITPVRFALNSMDAANKAVSANKAFIYLTHEALMQKGYSKEDATAFLSEMLTGQKKEKALAEAEKFVNKHWQLMGIGDSKYAKSRASVRLADDFLKANIENATNDPFGRPNPMTAEIMEAVMKGGAHAAAVSLGHESNNPFSRKIQAGRQKQQQLYEDAVKHGDYNKAAKYKIGQIIQYDIAARLAAGGINWANLGFQYTGIPLLWKVPELNRRKQEGWTFDDKTVLQKQMQDRMETQRAVTRGLTGLMTFAAIAGASATYGILRKKGDDEDKTEGVFESAKQGLKKNPVAEKLFTKSAGQLSTLVYDFMKYNGADEKGALYASLEFLDNAANINVQFTLGARMGKAIGYAKKGKDQKALTEIGSITGSYIWPGGIPFYRPYREFYKFVKGWHEREKITPPRPETFTEGLLYGGAIEDFVNTFISEKTLEPAHMENWAAEHAPKTMGAGAGGKW